MKCSEFNCQNDCQFVCTCKVFYALCLPHLYYHSEICNKDKKTWELYSETSNSIIKQIQETKDLILNSAKKVTKDLQFLIKKSLERLDGIMKIFKIYDESFKRNLKENIRFCLEKVVEPCKKCEIVLASIDNLRIIPIQNEIMNIDTNLGIGQVMPEFFEYCVSCMEQVEKIEMDLIHCSEDFACRVCLKCRSLDSTQCIVCNKFYTREEYLQIIS